MFYSVDLIRIRKNKKGCLPACWLAATLKDFIGSGPYKLSRKEVENVDISSSCDDIIEGIVGTEGIPRFSLYLSSYLTFGGLRISLSQTNFLIEKVEKLYKDMISIKFSTKPKTKKSSKKSKDLSVNQLIDLEIPDIDLKEIFSEDQVDTHLLPEVDMSLQIDAGLEFYQEGDSLDFHGRVPPIFETTTDDFQSEEVHRESEAVKDPLPKSSQIIEAPGTPKRKSCKPHDETPTKRKRTSHISDPSGPRDNSQDVSARPTSRTSILRKTTSESAISAEVTIDGDNALPMMPNIDIEMKDPYQLPIPEEIPIVRPAASDSFELEELDEFFNRRGRRSLKKRPIRDTERQISIRDNLMIPEVHTKPWKFVQFKLRNKIPAKELLMLPTTGLKLERNTNRSCSKWGRTLLEQLFLGTIENIILNPIDNYAESSLTRDVHVNKNTRYSTFKRSSNEKTSTSYRPSSSTVLPPSTPSLITNETTGIDDQDMMPPPAPPTSLLYPSPRTPKSVREPIDSATAASPRQEHQDTPTDPQHFDLLIATAFPGQDQPIPEEIFDTHENFSARMPRRRFDSSEIIPSSPSKESESHRNSLIMNKDEFCQLVEDMWKVSAAYIIDEDPIQFELKDILVTEDSSIEELIKYLCYIYEFEKSKKLYIKQENVFYSVYIIKEESTQIIEEYQETDSQ